MRIGIALFGHAPGAGGGVGIYARNLLEAISAADIDDKVFVLMPSYMMGKWRYRKWPENFEFVGIDHQGILDKLRRHFFPETNPYFSESIPTANKIDALNLDVVHFPCTTLNSLDIKTPCVLTFFDMQHEYLPGFFTDEELIWRNKVYGPSVENSKYVIAPTNFTKLSLIEKYQTPEEKIGYIAAGISPSFVRPEFVETDKVEKNTNFPEKFCIIRQTPGRTKITPV